MLLGRRGRIGDGVSAVFLAGPDVFHVPFVALQVGDGPRAERFNQDPLDLGSHLAAVAADVEFGVVICYEIYEVLSILLDEVWRMFSPESR